MASTVGSLPEELEATRHRVAGWLIVSNLLLLLAWPLLFGLGLVLAMGGSGYGGADRGPVIQKAALEFDFGVFAPSAALLFSLLAWIPYRLRRYNAAAIMAILAVASVALVVGWMFS